MSSPSVKVDVDALRKSVKAQGEVVKSVKKNGGTKEAVAVEVEKLNKLKIQLAEMEQGDPEVIKALALAKAEKDAEKTFRAGLEDLLTRRFFYIPSFEIYQGVGGLYDFGPAGCAVKQNLVAAWRQHFVLYENMLEVDCSAMTPEIVLKTSGHVDKFTDFMVKDEKTGECYRADKLVEEYTEKALTDPKNPVDDKTKSELLAVTIITSLIFIWPFTFLIFLSPISFFFSFLLFVCPVRFKLLLVLTMLINYVM